MHPHQLKLFNKLEGRSGRMNRIKPKSKQKTIFTQPLYNQNSPQSQYARQYALSKEPSFISSSTYQPQPIPQERHFEDHLQFPQDISMDYNVLKLSGLLDAYQLFLKSLIRNGLPNGPIYQYAAQEMQKYEKRKLNKQLRMKAQLDIQRVAKRGASKDPEGRNQKTVLPYRPS